MVKGMSDLYGSTNVKKLTVLLANACNPWIPGPIPCHVYKLQVIKPAAILASQPKEEI